MQQLSSCKHRLMIGVSIVMIMLSSFHSFAQGTWDALRDPAPNLNTGVMLLLTDGSVICKAITDANDLDGTANIWNKLTPDRTGSYKNGTWSTIAPMADARFYFSSQMLKSGKIYVAGGEYGPGVNKAELYDPIADTWTPIPGIDPADSLADANSKILPDGRVLQNIVNSGQTVYGQKNIIYDPVTNTYSPGPSCRGDADESAWVILPDNSILFIDIHSLNTERYIPSQNRWIGDAPTPVLLYDNYIYEDGPSIVLADGTVLFIGANDQTAIYVPTNDLTNGQWVTGPRIPGGNGIPDGSAAMLTNGKVLCAVSPMPNAADPDSFFHNPTFFYEFDHDIDSFIQVAAPYGAPYVTNLHGPPFANVATYTTNMLDLPDGTVLFSTLYDDQYYIYTPDGTPLDQGKPTISAVTDSGCQYMITGSLFNGISEGAAYGDDWQMSTNYPIVRLSAGGNVYYARTHDWNRTGIQQYGLSDTAYFSVPNSLPNGTYSLTLGANGINSDPYTFNYRSCTTIGIVENKETKTILRAQPNPSKGLTQLLFTTDKGGDYAVHLADLYGREIMTEYGVATEGNNSYMLHMSAMAKGVYVATLEKDNQSYSTKIVLE